METKISNRTNVIALLDGDLVSLRTTRDEQSRLLDDAASHRSEPILMDESTVRSAPIATPWSKRQMTEIETDLRAHPEALLNGALKALLERGAWIEQETLIGEVSHATASFLPQP